MIPHLQLILRALNTQLLIKTDKVGIDTPVSFSVLKKLKHCFKKKLKHEKTRELIPPNICMCL